MQTAHRVLRVSRAIQLTRYICLPSGGLGGSQSTSECIDQVSGGGKGGSRYWYSVCESAAEFHAWCPGCQPSYPWDFASTEPSHLISLLSARNKQAEPITETKIAGTRRNTRFFQV